MGLERGAECPMRVGECKLGGRGVMDVVSDLLASLSGELGPKKFIQTGGGGSEPPPFLPKSGNKSPSRPTPLLLGILGTFQAAGLPLPFWLVGTQNPPGGEGSRPSRGYLRPPPVDFLENFRKKWKF